MRISPATPAPFQRDLCNAQFVTKNLKNSWRGALVRTDEASRDPAENKRIVRNGTITIGRIVLFAARSKLQRHEDAIRIVHVIAERFAIAEAADGVELASRLEGSH